MKNALSAFLTERIAEARDIWAAVVDVFSSKPPDPKRHAETPPENWYKATPTAPVPERPQKAVEVDFNLYTLAEIQAMTEDEYRVKVGCQGLGTRAELIKALTKKEKKKAGNGNAIEL